MRLLYFSPICWSSYAQRPHFMVHDFLSCGGREVMWVDPYPGRLPRWGDVLRSYPFNKEGTDLDPRIQVVAFRALPFEPLPGGFALNRWMFGRRFLSKVDQFAGRGNCVLGIGKPCALALDVLNKIRWAGTFYDAMDDFPNFHKGISRRSMSRIEADICQEVDEVLVSSSGLEAKFSGLQVPVTRIFNAFNPAVLPQARVENRTLVLGYIGSIGEWFDWDCVLDLARAVPCAEVQLIGPHLVPPPGDLPANVKTFSACRHDQIGLYLSKFAAGLIPFRKTLLTQGVDPIKYYEYRATGLPILTTTFGEMALRRGEPGVFFLDGQDGIETAVRNAIAYRPTFAELTRWRRENSWSARFSAAGLFRSYFPQATGERSA